jgi:hypothetical protein
MKIFWSWQSDTHGKTGRHFVRAALIEAIKELKQAEDVEEPSEREAREAIHLDHDRQGVTGSPDLAPTIFGKIDVAAVFISDVTLVAEIRDADGNLQKKLINSNVAIEYGYALKSLTDARVLMIQNTYYGSREELPFDLKHKAGPLQYYLAPNATKSEREAMAKALQKTLVTALRPYVVQAQANTLPAFQETSTTSHQGVFWQPGDILAAAGDTPIAAAIGRADAERVEYRLDEPRVLYLRLIPTSPLPQPLKLTTLSDIVENRRLNVLAQNFHSTLGCRNKFGAIAYQPESTGSTPVAITQTFRNGEIWAVSRAFVVKFNGNLVIPMITLTTAYTKVIENFIKVATENIGLQLPYMLELGAVGLKDVRVSIPREMARWANDISEPIFENEISIRRILNNDDSATITQLVQDFARQIYDLAGIALT